MDKMCPTCGELFEGNGILCLDCALDYALAEAEGREVSRRGLPDRGEAASAREDDE